MIKKLVPFLFLSCALLAEDFDEVKFNEEAAYFFPFSVTGGYMPTAPANFSTREARGEKLTYNQGWAAFAYNHPFSPYWGLIFGSGWIGIDLDWQENPFFHENNFNYITFSVGGFNKALDDWIWTATISSYLDTEELDIAEFALYQGVLWGKYSICKPLEFDVGFIIEAGLNKTKIWPIIGFIYNFRKNLHLTAIYPIDVSLSYDFFDCLSAGGSLRFIRNRFRVSDLNPLPHAIFEYQTIGAEFDLNYSPFDFISIEAFVGSTLGGDLKIANRNDHDTKHFKFDGSLYGGVSGNINF